MNYELLINNIKIAKNWATLKFDYKIRSVLLLTKDLLMFVLKMTEQDNLELLKQEQREYNSFAHMSFLAP
jgi:hypothetical protein